MIKVFLFDYVRKRYYALNGLFYPETLKHMRFISPAWRSAIVCPFYCHRLSVKYQVPKDNIQ